MNQISAILGEGDATRADVIGEDLSELLRRVREATRALIQGDVHRYFALVDEAPDYTLMPPTGGPTRHGSDPSPETVAALEEFFAGSGDGDFELERTYTSGNLAVLVGVERQHGTVGGIDQDWSLRVTLVFRREDFRWRLVHRHADALVHPIDMEHVSRLAAARPPRPAGSGRRRRVCDPRLSHSDTSPAVIRARVWIVRSGGRCSDAGRRTERHGLLTAHARVRPRRDHV